MKTIKGDLVKLAIKGEFDLIIHGCNCFCTMGAGIAKTIRSHLKMFLLARERSFAFRRGAKTEHSRSYATLLATK
mgnify:FL=1